MMVSEPDEQASSPSGQGLSPTRLDRGRKYSSTDLKVLAAVYSKLEGLKLDASNPPLFRFRMHVADRCAVVFNRRCLRNSSLLNRMNLMMIHSRRSVHSLSVSYSPATHERK